MTSVFLLWLTSARFYCWMKTEGWCCASSFQEPGMMTPQRARRRRMMPSFLEDTMSMCGTSAPKTDPPPATQSASPTPTHPRWTRSEMWTQDSSVLCSSANQVSVVRHCQANILSLDHLWSFEALSSSSLKLAKLPYCYSEDIRSCCPTSWLP